MPAAEIIVVVALGLFAAATAEQRDAVRSTVAEITDQFRTDDGRLAIPARALLLEAR